MKGSRVWFTADLHLGHKNIIKYCDRPFDTIEGMDEYIIDMWNHLVEHDDEVYVLGDFILGDYDAAVHYFNSLRGVIRVIPGGHDYRWLRPYFISGTPSSMSGHPVIIEKEMCNAKLGGLDLVLCHYPMRTWPRSHYGSIQLHGHSHGRLDPLPNQYDVGLDNNDLLLVSFQYMKVRVADGST